MKIKVNNIEYELICLVLTGSRQYGTFHNDSDYDYRGVIIEPIEMSLGVLPKTSQLSGGKLFNSLKDLNIKQTDDIVLYELNNFATLAMENNPNILDILFSENTVYNNEKWNILKENRHLFLSKKSKFTFSGYAINQIKKVKNHKKNINEFPNIFNVFNRIKSRLEGGYIDYGFISKYFGEDLANSLADKTFKLKTPDSWNDFCSENSENIDYDNYKLPIIESCIKVYNNNNSKLELNDELINDLYNNVSFRHIGESVISIFSNGKGVIDSNGQIRKNDSEFLGDFKYFISIDYNNHKKDYDRIIKLWNWKINRNEKRSLLESEFGFDTKHVTHLIRLIESAKQILLLKDYKPELNEDILKLINNVKNGILTYDNILKYTDESGEILNDLYNKSSLQKSSNIKKVNDIILKIKGVK